MEAEMSLDLNRIWHRNMGRDDRVISNCGKEARFPYLDTELLKFMMPTARLSTSAIGTIFEANAIKSSCVFSQGRTSASP